MTKFDEEKRRLLLELKQETRNQLAAVKSEDAEEFLMRTEACSRLIGSYNALEILENSPNRTLTQGLKEILLEIADIRKQIDNLISPLNEKLKQKSAAEKKINFARQHYRLENLPLPSVFMDKKI